MSDHRANLRLGDFLGNGGGGGEDMLPRGFWAFGLKGIPCLSEGVQFSSVVRCIIIADRRYQNVVTFPVYSMEIFI